MKTLIDLMAVIAIMITSSVQAQTDTLGWGPNSSYARMYDPKTVMAIEGRITEVQDVAPISGMSSSGVHLSVASGGSNYSVLVGPRWFLDKQSLKLNENDNVKIKGSRVNLNGTNVIIVQSITKGKGTLILRDEVGIPKWSMRKRGKKSR